MIPVDLCESYPIAVAVMSDTKGYNGWAKATDRLLRDSSLDKGRVMKCVTLLIMFVGGYCGQILVGWVVFGCR